MSDENKYKRGRVLRNCESFFENYLRIMINF